MIIQDYFKTNVELRSPTNEELASNSAILGVICGEHFCPGSLSRNKRFYPEDNKYGKLWHEQLQRKELQERINNNMVAGTIGHDLNISEKEYREGLVSHFTKNYKIIPTGDPKHPFTGYAESFILDTPAGRALHTYMKAGMQLYTSTRADGDFIPGVTYKVEENGEEVRILDPKVFRYERNDFVIAPGFLYANPKLREELDGVDSRAITAIHESYEEAEKVFEDTENSISCSSIKESSAMNPNTNTNALITQGAGDVVIRTTDGNQISISKANGTDSSAQNTDAPHNKASTATSKTDKKGAAEVTFSDDKQNTLTESILANALEQIEDLKAENDVLREAVASDAKPDVNDLTKSMLASNLKKIDPLQNVGHTADVVSALKSTSEGVNEEEAVSEGTTNEEDLAESLEIMEDFISEAGSPEKIIEALKTTCEFHEEVGSPPEIMKTLETFRQFEQDVGTPDEILEAIQSVEEFHSNVGTREEIVEMAEFVESFFGKYGTPEKVAKTLESTKAFFDEVGTPDEIRESLSMMESLHSVVEEYKSLGLTNLSEMKEVLESLQATKLENKALSIAEHTGLNSSKVMEYLKNGMSEREIVDMHNDASEGFYDRYLTVREDIDSVPLRTVDPDGNNVQLKNASYKSDVEESMPRLSRVLSKIHA